MILAVYLTASLVLLALSFRTAIQAKHLAESVVADLSSSDINGALRDLADLQASLDRAERLRKPSFWMAGIPVVRADYGVYREGLKAGTTLAASINTVVFELSKNNLSRTISFDTLDFRSAPALLLDVYDDVLAAGDHLVNATSQAENLHLQLAPEHLQSDLIELISRLQQLADQFLAIKPYLEQIPFVLGSGQPHDILVLLQNPHELRPTGGFIGTIGRISFDKGQITTFYTDDVYRVDGQLLGKETIPAPLPLQRYANVQWLYLRDANWSPDFPSSAEQILRMYKEATGDDSIDTVIAITPYIVQRLLEITGPLTVGGITFTPENLIDAIQYRVEQEFWRIGISEEDRKSIINDLSLVLKDHVLNLDEAGAQAVVNAFLQSLSRREILLYSKDSGLNAFITDHKWDGSIPQSETDFLYVVDANIGALKTDRLVDRLRTYQVRERQDGQYEATLRLTYKNNGFFDYRTTRYRTYVRVYVPIGSELIQSTGFVDQDKSFSYVAPQVYAEFDKTVFAGFVSVEPGQERYAELTYLLPPWLQDRIKTEHRYALTVKKQPGTQPHQYRISLNQGKRLISIAPSDLDYSTENQTGIRIIDELDQDRDYVIRFAD